MSSLGPVHRMPVRVYYEDTDFSGAVYHASYLRFMERGRTELLRTCGLNQGALMAGQGEAAYGFVVRDLTISFITPARMDDWLEVETQILTLRGASLEMEQIIRRQGAALAKAKVKIACVAQGRPLRLPESVRKALSQV